MPAPLTQKQFKELLKLRNTRWTLLDAYKGMRKPSTFRCKKCKIEIEINAERIVNDKYACPQCSLSAKDKVHRKLALSQGFTPLARFSHSCEAIDHKCKTCKTISSFAPTLFQQRTAKCRICHPENPKIHTKETYTQRLSLMGLPYTLVGKWKGFQKKTDHMCNNCSFVWEVQPRSIVDYYSFRDKGCPNCFTSIFKSYRLGRRTVLLRGYEPKALDWILEHTSIKPQEIRVDRDGDVPKIPYRFGGLSKIHHPDFWVPSRNILVEVKSYQSVGLGGVFFDVDAASSWRMQCAKAKAALKLGYDYRLLLMDDYGRRVALPKDWFNYSRTAITKLIRK